VGEIDLNAALATETAIWAITTIAFAVVGIALRRLPAAGPGYRRAAGLASVNHHIVRRGNLES